MAKKKVATKKIAASKKISKVLKKVLKEKKVEKDPRDQQTKAAGDKTTYPVERPQQTSSYDKSKTDKPKKSELKIEKANKDPKLIEEAVEKLLDARNEYLDKIDEANEGINDESTEIQINQLREDRSNALIKFQSQWEEFRKLMEKELQRQF